MHRQASAAQSPLAQAHGTSSKMRSYFYPWERLTTERPNTIRLARCKMSSQAFSPRGKDLAMQRDFGLKPRKPAYPPGLETQRLATDCSSVMPLAAGQPAVPLVEGKQCAIVGHRLTSWCSLWHSCVRPEEGIGRSHGPLASHAAPLTCFVGCSGSS